MKRIKLQICIVVFLLVTAITLVFAFADFSPFKTNQNGQTYGSLSGHTSEDSPNLIWARGIDGTSGYVKSSDLFGPTPSSPEEALKLQELEEAKGLYTIPLYDSDGETVIGEFMMGGGNGKYEQAEIEEFIASRLNES